MAVVIRLARHGQRNRPFYRIVATEKTSRRDGKFIEVVGTYNTISNPPLVSLKADRIKKFLDNGAIPSLTVQNLLKKELPGYYEGKVEAKRAKIQAKRKARKNRTKAK